VKKVIYSQPIRILAFLLAIICLPLAVGATVAAAWSIDNSFSVYGNPQKMIQSKLQNMLWSYTDVIMNQELYNPGAVQAEQEYINLRFTVILDGVVLETTEQGDETIFVQESFDLAQYYGLETLQQLVELVENVPAVAKLYRVESDTQVYKVIPEEASLVQDAALLTAAETQKSTEHYGEKRDIIEKETAATDGQSEQELEKDNEILPGKTPYQEGDLQLTVFVSLANELQPGDRFAGFAGFMSNLLDASDWFIPVAGIGYLFALIGLLISFCAAGHIDQSKKAVPTRLCNVPLEGVIILFGTLGVLAAAGGIEILDAVNDYSVWNDLFSAILAIVGAVFCLFAMETFVLGALLNLAVRFKCGIFWKNSLVWWLIRWLGRITGKGVHFCFATVCNLPVLGKTVFLLLGGWIINSIVILILIDSGSEGLFFLHRLIAATLCIAIIVWAVVGLKDLQLAIRNMAVGDLDTPVRTDRLRGPMRGIGEDLTHIKEGVNLQVQERMKSEHLKTELITNVSHDIKTPLTSIINYVDLMKKKNPQDETLCGYLEVLDRQSNRLKKLIEDLIEASKASSGVLATNPQQCDLEVLLQQVLGEYTERLQAAGLTPVVSLPKQQLTVMADGRHLWRILDNLLNNICKYAQSGTRVYMDLEQQDEWAVLSFRNISRDQLNISAEELTERFIRGDRSRHTEGSGLGLSIARSLTELQGGQLQLAVDGDLFKAVVWFPVNKA